MSTGFDQFEFLFQNVSGRLDTGIVIAASRGGAWGVLNLETIVDREAAQEALDRVTRFARRPFGVRLDSQSPLAGELAAGLTPEAQLVILTFADGQTMASLVKALGGRQRRILIELTSGLQLGQIDAELFDGIVAKGHESGGAVGEESAFVLLQRLLGAARLPVFVQGGIGPHSAAGCYAAGAAGAVLDSQLLLLPESHLAGPARAAVEAMDGNETVCLGQELDCWFRVYRRPGMAAVEALPRLEAQYGAELRPAPAAARWLEAAKGSVHWGGPETGLWPLGQDASFAPAFARRFGNVAGVVRGLRRSVDEHIAAARRHQPLQPDSPLAQSHGTRYPILQGPMTRVSDTAEFANAVAANGALPFLALALLREARVRELLEKTRALLGDKPWGVGILGFVSPELRAEQLAVIREVRPRFALIAGGRPDQALALEQSGIATYLHVPTPALLRMFLGEGARRFIFEGRECGGHVGPRTSFVLWESMIDELLAAVDGGVAAAELHVVFAGGIHDARSSAVVAAMAAPLAARGVRVGALMGTAYLFTSEAVAAGAIVEGFQREALECRDTVILESGPGHATRCARTPFCDTFRDARRRLLSENKSVQEVRDSLEDLNLGRLRIASKGIARVDTPAHYEEVGPERQRREGMYMIGQVASLRDRVCSMTGLHEDVSTGGAERIASLPPPAGLYAKPPRPEPPCDLAIVGMGCLFPGAAGIEQYWASILAKVNSVREVPRERFDANLHYDTDRKRRDKFYSRWGGFLDDVPFDPVRYGIPPKALAAIDPLQLLTLVVTDHALRDAGYDRREFDRQRTSVILGLSGGLGDVGIKYAVRSLLPDLVDRPPEELLERLPEWTEDSFAGILLNVAAGRVANRFDFGGVNFAVDAACGSSLAAVFASARELTSGASDMVVTGGVDTVQSPFGFMCFSSSQALSPSGRCAPFDAQADGIAISEGIGLVVLKRLADAERDGDRIYAVIKGIAGSSDGRGRSMTAPRPEGQVLAMRRAYDQAGFPPSSVTLIEAHGTGTVAGDEAEVGSLTRLFSADGAEPRSCALGSVKSMLGHTKAAAGMAGLIKVALAIYHKTLPPTINVNRPNPKLADPSSPFFVSTEAQPWLRPAPDTPRRAGVSAFGFGGTNFHAVLEEYTGDFSDPLDRPARRQWPAELFVWRGDSREALTGELARFGATLAGASGRPLAEFASEVCARFENASGGAMRLALVAASVADLEEKLRRATAAIASGEALWDDKTGVYFAAATVPGAVAFLFSGQGSQKPGMLRGLALSFPECRETLEQADRTLHGRYPRRLSSYIYPPPAFTPEERQEQMNALTDTVVAQPALGAVEIGLVRVLERLGLRPDMTAGHSYGEYVALCAAGVFPAETLFHLSEARGRAIRETAQGGAGTMAAVSADGESTARALSDVDGVVIANYNSPNQTVIAGAEEGVRSAITRLEAAGWTCRPIPVACAFHSPRMRAARERLAAALAEAPFAPPAVPVYSNTLAGRYPDRTEEIRAVLARHLVSPVRFVVQIEAMYADGARTFVEVGPKAVLTGLVREILQARDGLCLHVDARGDDGMEHFLRVLAQLAARGAAFAPRQLFRGRTGRGQPTPEPEPAFLVRGGGAFARTSPPRILPPLSIGAPAGGEIPPAGLSQAPSAATPGPELHMEILPVMKPMPSLKPNEAPAGADSVMLHFQQTMAQFLQVEAAVMTAYLQGAPVEAPQWPAPPVPIGVPAPASSIAAAARQPPSPPAPVPGEREESPAPPPPAVQEPVARQSGEAAGKPASPQDLLAIVSEKTGYPGDMLDLDADMEADLGIDSIKKVEILGAYRRQAPPDQQAAIQGAMDRLTGARTLRTLTGILAELTSAGPAAPAAPAEPPPAARRDIKADLLNLVSSKTGYPVEMLSLESGIEADLGIDSIKRVEILGAFRRSCTEEEQKALQAMMDHLTSAPTLQHIIDRLEGALNPAAADSGKKKRDTRNEAPRFRLVTVPDRRERSGPVFFPGRVSLITDDETGLATQLAETLRAGGERPFLVRHSREALLAANGVYSLDLTNYEAVEALVEAVRSSHGPVGAVIHLLPLRAGRPTLDSDLNNWRDAVQTDARSLYALARTTQPDLERTGQARGALLAAVTGRGGEFGLKPSAAVPLTHHAVADFVKTAATELEGVRCVVIDLDVSDPLPILARKLTEEIAASGGPLQVGLPGDRRLTVRPERAPLAPPGGVVGRDWVFLLTGGARGITAEIARDLARHYRPTLILAGRAALSPDAEPPEIARAVEPGELKSALVACMSAGGGKVKIADVEAAFQRIVKDREIRRTLEELRAHGAQVEYHAVDARDEHALGALIEHIYASHGRLDVVIHGAGVIEDKLIRDKTPESFDRVVHTKADSSFSLSRLLRPEGLRCLIFMSSVTAAFGNRGQADYAVANGFMNGLALALAARWSRRVVAMNWGPWDQVGMASEEVRRQFLARGIVPIPVGDGCDAVRREMQCAGTRDALVCLGEGPWSQEALPDRSAGGARDAARMSS